RAAAVRAVPVGAGIRRGLVARGRRGRCAGWGSRPGGRVGEEESLNEAAARELPAPAAAGNVYLEQLYTFGHPQRDPRGRVVSVAYVGLVADADRVTGTVAGTYGGKYAAVAWHPASRLPRLAYDHAPP